MSHYLIISAGGYLHYVDRAGLLAHLADEGEYVEEGGSGPTFLAAVPTETSGGMLNPDMWVEGVELILKIADVVVPQPVTTKWSV